MKKYSIDAHTVHHAVRLVVTRFVLLGFLVQNVAGSAYYSLLMEPNVTVTSPPVILQNGTAGTSTIYANNTSARVSVAALSWLGGWDKRVKITVDSNDVDNALSTFPVLVYLSNSSGRNDDDVSFIFDELQNNANRKKIAITTSDGISQCYVEIEKWDDANEQAWLWVKVPNLSNITDTAFYLYYDKDNADNTVYVDDSTVGNSTKVWDSSFKAVLHLNQTPSGEAGEIKDSTSNANHGTTEGSMNSTDLVDAQIGSGLEFDEIDDLIRVPNSTSLSFNKSSGTCELWINWANASDGDHQIVMTSSNRFTTGAQDGFEWASQGDGDHFFYPWGGDGSNYNLGPNPFTKGVGHHLVVTYLYVTREVKIYVDAVNMSFTTENVPTFWTQLANTSDWLWGGNPDRSTRYFDGVFDEIRIHSEARSNAWIKASYKSGRDHLLDFGLEEIWNWWDSRYDYRRKVSVTEPNNLTRIYEPVEVYLTFVQGSCFSKDTIRVAYWNGSTWSEISSQVYNVTLWGDNTVKSATILWNVDVELNSSKDYYVYYDEDGEVTAPSYTGLSTPSVVNRGTTFNLSTSYGTGDTIKITGTYYGVERNVTWINLKMNPTLVAWDDWYISPGIFHLWINGSDVFEGGSYIDEADTGPLCEHSDGTNYAHKGNASSVTFEIVGPLLIRIKIVYPSQNPGYGGTISGTFTDVFSIYYTPDSLTTRTKVDHKQEFPTAFTEATWRDWAHLNFPAWDVTPTQTNLAYNTSAGMYTEALAPNATGGTQHSDWTERWIEIFDNVTVEPALGLFFMSDDRYTINTTNYRVMNVGGQGSIWGIHWFPYWSVGSNVSGTYNYEFWWVAKKTNGTDPIRDEYIKALNPITTSIGSETPSPQGVYDYDYVLGVNNTATAESWEIRLKKYSNSSIGRLQNCTIYFHNSTDGSSTQIYIENGLFNQIEGSWYNLDSLETIYIAMSVEASSIGPSHVYAYLEIRTPGTTTYFQYTITFEIT